MSQAAKSQTTVRRFHDADQHARQIATRQRAAKIDMRLAAAEAVRQEITLLELSIVRAEELLGILDHAYYVDDAGSADQACSQLDFFQYCSTVCDRNSFEGNLNAAMVDMAKLVSGCLVNTRGLSDNDDAPEIDHDELFNDDF